MKISNRAIVAVGGCIIVGLVACLLQSPGCLWALVLIMFLVDEIKD